MAGNFRTVSTFLINGMSSSFSTKASSFLHQVFYELTSFHTSITYITYLDSLLYYVLNVPVPQSKRHNVIGQTERQTKGRSRYFIKAPSRRKLVPYPIRDRDPGITPNEGRRDDVPLLLPCIFKKMLYFIVGETDRSSLGV